MTLGEGTGILAFIRSWLSGRPKVQIVPRLRDYGPVRPGFITTRIGLYLEIEIHNTGGQPLYVREVGMQLSDNTTAPLGRVKRTLTRPDFHTVSRSVDEIKRAVGDRVVVGFYALATPDRLFDERLPEDWRGFPARLPPTESGR